MTVFPAGLFNVSQRFNERDTKGTVWVKSVGSNTFTLMYNLCDTIGRKLASCITVNKRNLCLWALIRLVFLGSYPLNVFIDQKSDNKIGIGIFLSLNALLLGLTNGIVSTLTMSLAPTLVTDDSKKGPACASVGFFNTLGIIIGNIVCFGMNAAIVEAGGNSCGESVEVEDSS